MKKKLKEILKIRKNEEDPKPKEEEKAAEKMPKRKPPPKKKTGKYCTRCGKWKDIEEYKLPKSTAARCESCRNAVGVINWKITKKKRKIDALRSEIKKLTNIKYSDSEKAQIKLVIKEAELKECEKNLKEIYIKELKFKEKGLNKVIKALEKTKEKRLLSLGENTSLLKCRHSLEGVKEELMLWQKEGIPQYI